MNPAVSVVMSVYNGERFLREAIDSILNQTFTDFEFIIVNDGSTDGTGEILESYRDERIILVTQDNVGLTKALNNGIALARGKYIARQDADDISKPERLEKQVAFMEAHPVVGLLGTRFEAIDEKGQVTRLAYLQENNKVLQARLLEINQFSHGSVMIRKEALDKVGLFRDFFKYAQDYDLWLRIAEQYEVANLPEFLFCYRELDLAISSKKILTQSLYAGVAREMAMQRIETGSDSIQQGLIPTLPSVQRLSKGLHNKLITFYTQNPQEMLDGLNVNNKANKDLVYLFKEICVEKHLCENVLNEKYAEIKQADERIKSVLTELHNVMLDSIDKLFAQKFNEIIETNNSRHSEDLRQKDEQLRTKDEQLRQKYDELIESNRACAEANTNKQMLARELHQQKLQLQQKDEQIGQYLTQLQQKDEHLRQKCDEILESNRARAEANTNNQMLAREVQQQKLQLQQKDEKLRQMDVQIVMESKRHEEHVHQADEQLAQLNLQIVNKEQHLLDKDQAFRQKEEQLQEKADEIKAFVAQIAEERAKEKHDYELRIVEKERRIQDLLNSKSWKITAPIRKTLDMLQKK